MLPLAKKIFGDSALGGSSGPTGPSARSGDSKVNHLATFGSSNKTKKSKKGTVSSEFDTINEDSDSKYIILEERSFQFTEGARDPDENSTHERIKAVKQNGW